MKACNAVVELSLVTMRRDLENKKKLISRQPRSLQIALQAAYNEGEEIVKRLEQNHEELVRTLFNKSDKNRNGLLEV